jgi:CTP synthase (UTP-ammonia lyase)
MPRLALIGDYDSGIAAHHAIPQALALAGENTGIALEWDWIGTGTITDAPRQFAKHAGLWCVPGSPYRDLDGALAAIRFAREQRRPFLGTCGGFQHAVVEYARTVLGWSDADHAETAPGAGARLVIAPLACELVEASGVVRFIEGTRLAAAYGAAEADEGYHCRYGLNPAFREALLAGPLHVAAVDAAGEVRAVELQGHPFYVGTLFQPERAALAGRVPPIVAAFLRAARG